MIALDAATLDALAERIAQRLDLDALAQLVADHLQRDGWPADDDGLVDAATLARQLGISRTTVYERADELGAVRIGDGPRPRLRFDPKRARAACRPVATHDPAAPAPTSARPPRPRRTAGRVLTPKGSASR